MRWILLLVLAAPSSPPTLSDFGHDVRQYLVDSKQRGYSTETLDEAVWLLIEEIRNESRRTTVHQMAVRLAAEAYMADRLYWQGER